MKSKVTTGTQESVANLDYMKAASTTRKSSRTTCSRQAESSKGAHLCNQRACAAAIQGLLTRAFTTHSRHGNSRKDCISSRGLDLKQKNLKVGR